MRNRIVLCVNCFQEGDKIAESLATILPYVDDVILVDGAYKDYPTPNDLSDDGTIERAKWAVKNAKKGFILVTKTEGRWTEVEKRNAYLEYLQENYDWAKTWAFIWDADWFLKPDEANEEAFRMLREADREYLAISRIFTTDKTQPDSVSNIQIAYRAIPELHYTQNHFTLRDREDCVVNQVFQRTLNLPLMIEHRRDLWSSSKSENQKKYYCEVSHKYEK